MLNTKILLLSLVLVLVITLSVFFILKDNIKFELFENNVIPNELINEREQLKDTNYITMADISSGINTNKVDTQNLNVGGKINGNSMNINKELNIKGGKSVHNPKNYWTHFPWRGDGKNYIRGDTEIRGNVNNIGDLTVGGKINGNSMNINKELNIKGGKSVHNPNGWWSHFPWIGDGKNYIRGDTEIRGNVNNIGDLTVGGRFRTSENHRCFFHETAVSDGAVANNTNVFLDRLGWYGNWTCPSNTYLNGLRFQNKGWGRMNMLYKCCKIDKD